MLADRKAVTLLVCLVSAQASPAEPDEELLEGAELVEIVEEAPVTEAAPPPEEVSREEVRSLPGARGDALEGIRNLPGVAFAASYEGAAGDLIIRGTSGADSWYLLDGVAVPAATHMGSLTAVLPVEMLQAIELEPGGFDVAHGRATGGVVEMKTRAPRLDRWGGAADVSFVHASAFAEGPVIADRLGLAVSLRRSFLDAFLPEVLPDDAGFHFTTAPRYHDGQIKADYVPSERHHLTLLGVESDDRLALNVEDENANDPVFTGDLGSHYQFWRAILAWHFDGGPLQTHATLAYGRDWNEVYLNDDFYLDLRVDDVTVRQEVAYTVGPFLRLRTGGDVRALKTDARVRLPLEGGEGAPDTLATVAPVLELDDRLRDVHSAAWLAGDLHLGPVAVTPGVRVDHFRHIHDVVVQPRLSAQVELGGGLATQASVGRFCRPLINAEQVPKDLEAETAIQASAGLEQRIGDDLRVRATLFSTWLRDLTVVDPMRIEDDAFDAYVSRGKGTARGMELFARLRRGDLFGWIAYTYTRSRRIDGPGMPERRFEQDQPHNLVATASWKFGRSGSWRVGGRFRLASGTPYTPVVGAVYRSDLDLYQPMYGASNSERLETAHQLDLRIDRRFTFRGWNLSAYLDVSNVYAHPRVVGYSYDFDYTHKEPITDLPLLPSIGVRGEL